TSCSNVCISFFSASSSLKRRSSSCFVTLIVSSFRFGRVMVFLSFGGLGFVSQPPTIARLFAELRRHYRHLRSLRHLRLNNGWPTGIHGRHGKKDRRFLRWRRYQSPPALRRSV